MIRRFSLSGAVIFCFFVIVCFFIFGFLFFTATIPRHVEEPSDFTDAIVVLTGGSERIVTGLNLLEAGWAKKLFVSGVSDAVDLVELLAAVGRSPDPFQGKVELGHDARDTFGNAMETQKWMQKNKFKSIRLVTAAYHMPRSLREFSLISPTIVVVPHPVFPSNVHLKSWWMWSGSASLLVSEYLKTLFIYLRTFLDALDLVQ